MRPDTRHLLGFLAAHLLVGTLAAAVFVTALLATDALGLAGLLARDRDGGVAMALLAFGAWVTFGGLAVGAGIMGVGATPPTAGPPVPGPLGAGQRRLGPVRPRSGSRSSR